VILNDAVRTLMQQAILARISVIDDQGYPHTVPIWFVRDGDEIVFFSSRTARKIAFMRKNPKGAVSIGGNPYGSEGYLVKGTFAIEEDPGSRWLREITFRYEPPELADQHVREWAGPDIVVMRFTPQKISKV
jgi:general stress protein 26